MKKALLLLRKTPDLFRDDFGAGHIDATKWIVTDTGGKLSVANGALTASGGSGGWNNPRATDMLPFTVKTGLTALFRVTISSFGAAGVEFGWDSATPVAVDLAPGVWFHPTPSLFIERADASTLVGVYPLSTGAEYWVMIVLTNPGAKWYISSDGGKTYTLVWLETAGYTAAEYIGFSNNSAAFTYKKPRVFQGTNRPPIVQAAAPTITPTLGAELVTGNLTIGTWYQITATQADYFYAGCAIGHTFRATAATALDANNKVKAITLSSMLGPPQAASHQGIFDAAVTVAAGLQAGAWIHCDSADDGSGNGVEMVVDRVTNTAYVSKYVAGALTQQLTSGAITYAAGATVRLLPIGTSYALYYNNLQVGATQTINDGALASLTGMRVICTDSAGQVTLTCNNGIGIV